MKRQILSVFLIVNLLLGQLPLYAGGPKSLPARRAEQAIPSVTEPAKSDYLGRQNAFAHHVAETALPAYQAADLQARAEKALKEGRSAEFYVLLNQLNTLLLTQIKDPFLPTRLNALHLLAGHIKEGFISAEEQKQTAFYLEKILQNAKKCQGNECRFLGLGVLTLALCAQTPNVQNIAAAAELPGLSNKQRILSFYSQLLAKDYGSDQANQLMGEHILRASAWLGGLDTLQAQLTQLVRQAGTGGYTYDAKNYKLQRFAVELISAFGASSVPVLQALASQSPSLTVRTHAAIELAYKHLPQKDMQQVRAQLEYIYCDLKLRLPAQLDFELRQQIGYAYGQGQKPAFITDGQPRCLVVVPSGPNPHLILDEWVLKAGKEAVLWFAPTAALKAVQSGWKIFRHLKALRLYVNTHHGMSLRQFYQSGRHLPLMGAKKELTTALQNAAKAQKAAPSARTGVVAFAEQNQAAADVQAIRSQYLQKTQDLLAATRQRTDLSAAQRAHVERLAQQVQENPNSSYVLGEVSRTLKTLPDRHYNALMVMGSRVEGDEKLLEQLRRTFMADGFGYRRQGMKDLYGLTKPHLRYELKNYGLTSDEILLRWDTHGGINSASYWAGELNPLSEITMPEIIHTVLENLQGARQKSITLFLDSCYPGAAFKDFMSLPAQLIENFNLFALGGHMQLNFPNTLPLWLQQGPHSPKGYAAWLWKAGAANAHTITGKAFVEGKVIDPLAQAIEKTRYFRPTTSKELQLLQQVTLAEEPFSLYKAVENFVQKVPGASIKNLQWPMPYYIIPYDKSAVLKDPNQLFIPFRLVDEIQESLSKITF